MSAQKKWISLAEAKQKAEKYCTYQERCHSEVQAKLRTMGLAESDIQDVMIHLIERNFLNEERFALAFAGGKFRTMGWGRKKIIYHLKAKGIDSKLISRAIEEIDPELYLDELQSVMIKKDASMKNIAATERMAKMSKFLVGKGFEMDLVISAVKKFYKK